MLLTITSTSAPATDLGYLLFKNPGRIHAFDLSFVKSTVFYPEATARYIARQRGLRVITHEVGLQPASAFFTDGEATTYGDSPALGTLGDTVGEDKCCVPKAMKAA